MGEKRKDQYRKYLKEDPRMYQAAAQVKIAEQDPGMLAVSHVFAPALGSFVMWVLENAVKSGKKRLYFLARDGWFMYRAALVICGALQLPLECRYLNCSRYSLRIPMYHLDREEALDFICRRGIGVTPDRILQRAGLSGRERKEVLKRLGLPFANDEVVPFCSLPMIRKRLSRCEEFLEAVDYRSKKALPALIGYFRQEGLLEEKEDAVVDSGWVGSMQRTLNEILLYMGRKRRMEGYYWGLYDLPPDVLQREYHWYYFGPGNGLWEKAHFNNCIFEAVFSAPCGMTIGYEKEKDVYAARFGSIREEVRRFRQENERCLMEYVSLYAMEIKKTGYCKADMIRERNVVRQLLSAFMGQPSRQEAKIFGALPFSEDMVEGGEQPVALPMKNEDLGRFHLPKRLLSMLGLRKGNAKESAWYEGSVIQSNHHVKYHLAQHRIYLYIRFLGNQYRFWKKRQKGGRS